MRILRVLLVLGVLAALVAGCGGGGGSDVSGQDVAVVGPIHIKRARFDALIDQAKKSFQQQGRPFPKAGSQEYAALRAQAVTVLVQAAERQVRAEDEMNIKVTDKDVDARLSQIKKQYFQGSDERYQQQLKKQGLTDEQVRADIKSQLVYERVFKKVTSGAAVTNDEIHAYYLAHSQAYARPQSREVRHILISTTQPTSSLKKKLSTAQAKKLADKVYAQLKGGANFAALAKKYSDDPGSKVNGGKLTVARGQTVPQFDATTFSLKTHQLSKPVKTQYGWHIIQALSPIRPPSATPEKQVRESIRAQLLQTKKNTLIQAWVKETDKKLKSQVKYAVGFNPPATTPATTTG
jgi:parvulin-like peptidyl-prolyl isomerase